MFPQIDSLPGSQRTLSVGNRQIQVRLGQDAAYMCWHIIGPLGRMHKHRIAIGDLPRHESFEITHDIRISIFAEHERGAGVVDEDMTHPGSDSGSRYNLLYIGA